MVVRDQDWSLFDAITHFPINASLFCLKGQKNQALSLKNPVVDAENTAKKTLPCPYSSDPLSCYQTVLTLIKWCPSPEECKSGKAGRRFFRKPASRTKIEEWEAKGLPWKLNSNHSQVIGVHTINPILKRIATMCNYINPEQCTAHGHCRAGISTCANPDV